MLEEKLKKFQTNLRQIEKRANLKLQQINDDDPEQNKQDFEILKTENKKLKEKL
jgi:hypothetical protein